MAYSLIQCIDLELSSSQYLSRADTAVLDVTTNWTIEMWIKPESNISGGKSFPFLSKDDGGGGKRSYSFSQYDAGGGVTKFQAFTSRDGGNTNYAAHEITYTPTIGVWTHVAVTFDGAAAAASRHKFIINGVDQGSGTNVSGGTGATSANNSTARVCIGAFDDTTFLIPNGYLFDGKMSLVRIWSSTRTPTQILDNMCNVFGTATTNLVAEWSLDGVATDASGNALTLTLNGSPSYSNDVPSTCVVATRQTLPLVGVGS